MITTVQVDVEQELASLCGVLNQSYARLVTIVSAALVDESWAIAGVRSPEHWLTMRAGLSPFRARQIVAIARRSADLPTVMGQFADGQLSVDQVTVVTRYAPAHVEASVAELAVHASVPQLRRALSRYSFDPPTPETTGTQIAATVDVDESGDTTADTTLIPDPPTWNGFALEQDRAGAPAELTMSYDDHGRFTLRYNAPADIGALVEAALTEAKDALFRTLAATTADGADPARPRITMGDAMTQIAARSMGSVTSMNRRDGYRTYLHLDTDGGWLTGKPRLPDHLTNKLTCDGILQPLWTTQGAPVNVGRTQRIVPPRTRRLVQDRDRGCRFPGCATTRVECHHLIHWLDGGPTDTDNLASLCEYHHDTHHAGDFTITGNANDPHGLTLTTRGGQPIRPGPTFTTPDPDTPPPTTTYHGPSGDTLSLRWVTFHEPRQPAA
jgi:hypothetical protein